MHISLWRLRLALTQVLNSCSAGAFLHRILVLMPSGAGIPACHCTVARPIVLYSIFQLQVPYIPFVPGSVAAYLRIVAPIAISRDKAYILISHIYGPPPEGAWVHYEHGTLRDRGPDLYPVVKRLHCLTLYIHLWNDTVTVSIIE